MISLVDRAKDDRSLYVHSFIFVTPEHNVQWAWLLADAVPRAFKERWATRQPISISCQGVTMNRIQKLCILICVFSPFLMIGAYVRGADIDDLVLLWGVFVTSFVGIFLFREKLLP